MAKKKKKNKTIYCIFCGAKNISTDTECVKCKKDLHPKNQPIKDFLYRHIKDELKGKVEDNIFSYLKNFIISNLYGVAMTISIIFTAVAIIVSSKSSYKVVSSIEDINQAKSSSKAIVATIYTYDDSCDEDFPQELLDVPFPSAVGIVSGRKKTATKINFKKGESIANWCSNGHNEDVICNLPLYVYDSKVEDTAKKYHEKLYEYADWYHTIGINDSSEYAERSSEVEDLAYELLYGNNLVEYNKENPIDKSVDLFISEVGCEY